MIELKDGLILGKSSPKKEVSFNYEKGEINYIDHSSFYIYKLYQFNWSNLCDKLLTQNKGKNKAKFFLFYLILTIIFILLLKSLFF